VSLLLAVEGVLDYVHIKRAVASSLTQIGAINVYMILPWLQ